MNTTAVCMNCKTKRDMILLDRIQKIDSLLSHIEVEVDPRARRRGVFYWDINLRCPYGMSCPEIRKIKIKTEKAARRLEPKMIKLAKSDDERMYHEILKLLAGHFPRVYKSMEELHRKKEAQ